MRLGAFELSEPLPQLNGPHALVVDFSKPFDPLVYADDRNIRR
jgi:hypothetical protein